MIILPCPECGKMISTRSQEHDCTPPEEEQVEEERKLFARSLEQEYGCYTAQLVLGFFRRKWQTQKRKQA